MKTFIVALALFLGACATTQHEVETIETAKLQVKGRTSHGILAINEKNQAVIREEVAADDELRIQEMVNLRLRDEADSELHLLKLCRRDVADPRLGGDGKISPIPAIDGMLPVDEVREELGIDEETGDFKVVRTSYFVEKLKGERKFEKTLRKMIRVAKEHLEQCEFEMAQARMKAGLPARRYEAKGYFTADGTWVGLQNGERDLQDAFEISARAQK